MSILCDMLRTTNIGLISPDLESNKAKYNNLEPVLHEIQKTIALCDKEKKLVNDVVHKVLSIIIDEMKKVEPLFNKLFNKILYGGSYYDGLKLHQPDEYDIDVALKLPGEMKSRLEVSDVSGFVRIRIDLNLLKTKPEYKAMQKFVDDSGFLLTEKFRDWFEGVLNRARNNLLNNGSRYGFEMCKSGPAFTLKVNVDRKLISVDLVPSFIFNGLKWPGPPFRKNRTQKNEFLVVPKTPIDSTRFNTSWRLSFQEQERDIINGKNGLKDTIRLLKGFKYFCKLLENKTIPYYWNEEYNLLTSKRDITLVNWYKRNEKIFNTLEKTANREVALRFFGLEKLVNEKSKESQIQKDMEETTECNLNGVDYIEQEVKLIIFQGDSTAEKIEKEINESPVGKKSIDLLQNSEGVKDHSCTYERKLSLWRDSTENEVFGVNVIKKLERMDPTQAIYAQTLITEILGQGLLKNLSAKTNITYGEQPDWLTMTSSRLLQSSNAGILGPTLDHMQS